MATPAPMHIIGLVITILVGISVWWWRLRMLKQASDTVIDAADRFRGQRRRKKIASDVGFSPITAIDEPVTAAATFIHVTVGREVWPRVHGLVKKRLMEVSTEAHAAEAVTYAEWAARQPIEDYKALGMLTEILREKLTLGERQELATILKEAASYGDDRLQARASREAIALVN